MDSNYFGKYTLSSETVEKLKNVKTLLKESSEHSDSTWRKLFSVETENEAAEKDEEIPMEVDNPVLSLKSPQPEKDDMPMPSTQFYFTQTTKKEHPLPAKRARLSLNDVIESIYNSLERNDECLDSEDIKNLTDANASEIIENLSQRLSLKGCYNLCSSVCDMDTVLASYCITLICSKLLLQKIIDLQKAPTRIEISMISLIVEKFPDDVRSSLVIPLFNVDLKNTEVILMLIRSYSGDSKQKLLSDFIETVKQLKLWHITVLPFLLNAKIDDETKTSILTLFVDKALNYAEDTNFSQCTLSFMKKNSPFSEEQKNMLHEIIDVNKTKFRRALRHVLDKMFFHRDMWHVS